MISDKFPGYSVVGEASTGPEALDAFRALEPDIILMDIELPEINGLEAALLILRERPETQIIVVSAYERFGYAQKAINTGVLGYVVKPLHEDALRNLLENAARNIANSQKSLRNQSEFHLYRTLAIKDMVTAFIHGSYGGLSAESFAKLLSQPIDEGMFMICSVRSHDGDRPLDAAQRASFEEAVDRFPNCYGGHWIGSVFPVFVSTFLEPTADSAEKRSAQVMAFVKEFVRFMQMKTSFVIHVSTGLWQTDPGDFPQSFHQAFDLFRSNGTKAIQISESGAETFTTGNNHIDAHGEQYPDTTESQMIHALVHGKREQVRETATSFGRWVETHTHSITEMRYAITELLIQIRRNQLLQIHGQLYGLIQSLLRVLDNFETRDQILDWFPMAIEHIIRTTDKSVSVEETNIQKILHYIDLNDLGSTISLENVADFIGLSPQYISKLFKQQFNINFIDYVIQRRIELACTLLKSTSLPVKDVSMRCGYNDVSYFSKVFAKFTGMSPREYRQRTR